MYLSLLTEKQKRLFISLAYNLAVSDGIISEEEKIIIKSYEKEMDMQISKDCVDKDLDSVVNEICELCGKKEKQIIVFEMIGLAMADYNYDDGERAIVKKAIQKFELNEDFGEQCEKKLSDYLVFQENLNALILQE